MPGCDTERFLEGFTDPFEIRFRPLIEDIEKQKGDLDGYYAKMVLHESIEALRTEQDSQPYPRSSGNAVEHLPIGCNSK